mmetsp:Transcript_29298/g.5289  ORF Transcript_29298/g.5289 Transcript_29298/m.5289 type:complete len:82 (+) Transcript_29298:598-843(+)
MMMLWNKSRRVFLMIICSKSQVLHRIINIQGLIMQEIISISSLIILELANHLVRIKLTNYQALEIIKDINKAKEVLIYLGL